MKRLILWLVTFAVTATVAFSSKEAQGQQPRYVVPPEPKTLPTHLPIGSPEKVLEGIVTNPLMAINAIRVALWFTNRYGTFDSSHERLIWNAQPESYAAYRSLVTSNALSVYDEVSTNQDYDGKPVYFYASIVYTVVHPVFLAFMINTNVGPLSGITSNTFATVLPKLETIDVYVPTGLQQLRIQVEPNIYTYYWSNGVVTTYPSPSPYMAEIPSSTVAEFNPWYCNGTNKVTIMIMSAIETNFYNQFGNLVQPSTLRMLDPDRVQVSMTAGSETVTESSLDLKAWTPIATNGWKLNVSSQIITNRDSGGSRFYRARYQ